MMKRTRVSLEEQETTINLAPLDIAATVYSSDPAVVKRLYSYAQDYPEQCMISRDDGYGVICELPKDWISYKPRKKRQLSENQRQAAIKNLIWNRKDNNHVKGVE